MGRSMSFRCLGFRDGFRVSSCFRGLGFRGGFRVSSCFRCLGFRDGSRDSSWFRRLGSVRVVGALTLAILVGFSAPDALRAQLGGRPADEWAIVLESGRRMAGLDIQNVVSAVELEPGDVVADVGAGTGIFSVPIGRDVGPEGVVLAVEVDEGFMKFIEGHAREAGLENIRTVLGAFEDPRLPRRDVDVAFFHDVIHHIADRETYLRNTAAYMAPESRVVVVDYRGGHPDAPHGDTPEMQITQDQVTAWMSAVGFELTREIPLFDEKFFVIYTRVD